MLKSSSCSSGSSNGRSLASASQCSKSCQPGALEVVGEAAARDQLAQPVVVGLDQAAILVGQEQHLGVAIVEHLLQRIGRGHGRQRHDAGAGTQAAHEGLEIFDRVRRQDRDLVALADAHAGQGAGDPVDPPVELAPGSRLALAHHGALVGKRLRMVRDADRDRDEVGKVVQRRLRHQQFAGQRVGRSSLLLRLDLGDRAARLSSRRSRPPSRWATGIRPMSCAVLVASAERQAPAQKKMNLLPLWK